MCEKHFAMHGSLTAGYDVDCTHVSNCCGADLRIEGKTTQYYICEECGCPCDIREPEKKAK